MKKYIAEKKENKELDGVELYFAVYPLKGTKENLKKFGFRWNPKKGCWYAKKSAYADEMATICAETTFTEYEEIAKGTGETVKEVKKAAEKAQPKKKAVKKETAVNLENLGENCPHLHGTELAKAIRDDLKARGVKGVSVRKDYSGYTTSITVTVKAIESDFASLEEAGERYNLSRFSCDIYNVNGIYTGGRWLGSTEWEQMTDEEKENAHREYLKEKILEIKSIQFGYTWGSERNRYFEFTSDFYNKVRAVYLIANQWNYNHSDSMTDYFDVGYYLDIDIKRPEEMEVREKMTEEERTAYNEEARKEEEKRQAEIERMKKEEAQRQAECEAYEAQRKIDREKIKKGITVVDLEESEKIYITNLLGGYGKENSIEELDESIKRADCYLQDALISRKVIFSDYETFELFGKYLLDDFDFLDKMGGTASEDVRLEEIKEIYQLNQKQIDEVIWYMNNCVAIYVGEKLELVSNPEGYGYSRYTYRLSEESEVKEAKKETELQRKGSENKEPFYFPKSVEKQIAKIEVGQPITIYQCDGWMLNSVYGGFGTVKGCRKGKYAQHEGIYIDLSNGKKETSVFVHNGRDCLIYKGIKPLLPESVTRRRISDNMYELYNYDKLLPNILEYYGKQGEKPILDTMQR